MENLYDSDKFDKVWKKVIAEGNAMQPAETEKCQTEKATGTEQTLREFMDDEASDEKYYAALAQKCGDRSIQREFQCLSSEEAGHLKRLQIAYFILTGDSYSPQATKPYITSMLDALRSRYIGEVNGEKAYQKAAMEEENGRLSQLYSELAMDEGRHAKKIEEIIERIIC